MDGVAEGESFLNGKVRLFGGDNREILKSIPDDSIDSIVCDPPYALVSIVKRFGNESHLHVSATKDQSTVKAAQYKRLSGGFMGQKWDTGESAHAVEFWQECLRVLKPGGHVVAFAGTRTYHRLACAIEDAGFEIRDMLQFLYGSGFPKSHDVSKGIDKRPGVHRHPEFAADLRAAMAAKGFTNTFDVAEKVIGRRTGAVANWQKYQWPEAKWWPALRNLLDMDENKWGCVIAEAERERIGSKASTQLAVAPGQGVDRSGVELDITTPATDSARQWQGWGTALKPANEPICLGRKPLSEGTVAANVIRWGCGALNIDGCRIETDPNIDDPRLGGRGDWSGEKLGYHGSDNAARHPSSKLGRWPANVVTDGSEEVVGMFPDTTSGTFSGHRNEPKTNGVYGKFELQDERGHVGDSGSAARFFYTSKADSDDRLGSRHPTVKPVDLMQWLVRLVTKVGGTVLDPFAGTGSTAEACYREGMSCILIEREEEYQADIRRRMALVLSGPDERARESIKAKTKDLPPDHGPLFA